MKTVNVQITVPEGFVPYLDDSEQVISFERNAMMLHPYIQRGIISHGRAAEIPGVRKWDLIEYYNGLGIPYLNQSKKDLLADLATFDCLRR
jgi:hypothetical protein